ncbi:MAG: hypothetical protein ABJE10_05455 [bacterium]
MAYALGGGVSGAVKRNNAEDAEPSGVTLSAAMGSEYTSTSATVIVGAQEACALQHSGVIGVSHRSFDSLCWPAG